jgi:signal transduction histidine kinase
MLDLLRLSFDTAKPVIFIEDITVGRTKQPAGRELVLPPGTHHVELRFDSIDLSSPEKIRFQYRMDDVDPVWLEADKSLTAIYTNIPVGTHAFRIRASNSAGVWDRSGISFPVIQKPYFYQTGWFRLVATTAFILTLTGAYRLRLRQIHAQMSARLDERVLERTRVARELHDTLLQSFQGVLFLFQAATNLLRDPPNVAEAKQRLDRGIDQAAQAITEGRNTIQGLRSSTIETNALSTALSTLAAELAANRVKQDPPVVGVQVEGTSRDLHPILRDEVYRIAGEALRNAFKHAQAKRIEVEIRYDERQLRLRVRDDGKGIDAKHLDEQGRAGHYGLRGMRERAKLMGGKLAVRSELDSGTEVELRIPASRAYEVPPARRRWWLAEKFSGKDTEVKS